MIKLTTKSGKKTTAYYDLMSALIEPLAPAYKGADFARYQKMVEAGYLERMETGPRGGSRWHITQLGRLALDNIPHNGQTGKQGETT